MTDIQNRVMPTCPRCGAPMRLFGIEPHQHFPATDIHTYGCDSCQSAQVVLTPTPDARVAGRGPFLL
jgi:hypothetical protein